MTEETAAVIADPPQPPPARKKRRAYKRRAKAPVDKPPAEFAGLTNVKCAAQCVPARCVISERGYCAHPMMGGLQPRELSDAAALNRIHRAKAALAHTAIDRRKA